MDFEIKSFVAVLLSHLLFVLYLIWAFVPDRFFTKIGIVYYPSKHWSCSFPLLILFVIVSLIIFIGFHERTMHPELDSKDSMIDEYSTFVKDDGLSYFDTPLEIVNKKLYKN